MGMKFSGVFQVFIIKFSCSTWISNKSFLFDSFSIAHEIWRQTFLKYFNLSGDADFSAKAHTHSPTEVFSQITIGMYYISLEKCNGRSGGACLHYWLSVCKIYLLSFDKHAIDFWWWFTFTQKQTFHAAVTDVALLLFKGAGQGCKGLGAPQLLNNCKKGG